MRRSPWKCRRRGKPPPPSRSPAPDRPRCWLAATPHRTPPVRSTRRATAHVRPAGAGAAPRRGRARRLGRGARRARRSADGRWIHLRVRRRIDTSDRTIDPGRSSTGHRCNRRRRSHSDCGARLVGSGRRTSCSHGALAVAAGRALGRSTHKTLGSAARLPCRTRRRARFRPVHLIEGARPWADRRARQCAAGCGSRGAQHPPGWGLASRSVDAAGHTHGRAWHSHLRGRSGNHPRPARRTSRLPHRRCLHDAGQQCSQPVGGQEWLTPHQDRPQRTLVAALWGAALARICR